MMKMTTTTRPPTSSPEFRSYLEEIVRTSSTRTEAAHRLGYLDTKSVWRYMKKLGVRAPPQWSKRPHLREMTQAKIPTIMISTLEGRAWVAALIQGEGCIQSRYDSDSTYLQLDFAMADPAPIFRLSDYLGVPRPMKPSRNHNWAPQWRKGFAGLRGLRVLKETLPFLLGQKRKEAEKAVDFFSPGGYHRGCFRNGDIWPSGDFPLRTKRRGSSIGNLPAMTGTASIVEKIQSKVSIRSQSGLLPNQHKVPDVVITTLEDRSWVGGILQGEGCIQSHYVKVTNSTTLDIAVGMTDPDPVFQLADRCGLTRPANPRAYDGHKPAWFKSITGVRSIRILTEVLPFLVGGKLTEAEKALSFFGPDGYRRGHFKPIDIWPHDEFPFRKRYLQRADDESERRSDKSSDSEPPPQAQA
jgi:hypothetical protein